MQTDKKNSVVIEAKDLSKVYRIWSDPAARLKYPLLRTAASLLPEKLRPRQFSATLSQTKYYRDFYALRDLSLTIRRGEAVGIIGRNGSGKSTLLQMIAGTLTPTTGSVNTYGRIAALLELGSGFNPEFTGRENVYLNAAVLGLSKAQIDQRYEAIAAFAEIGDFIDQPVRTYSSGMVVRLAFAVAAHVEPDILIVDEALGVGDARFQLKCARAIDRFIEQGVTLLFVSHDTTTVKRLCNQAILLERGQLVYAGKPNDVANLYSKLIVEGGSLESIQADIAALNHPVSAGPAGAGASLAVPAAQAAVHSAATVPSYDAASLRLRVKALETCLREQALDAELAAATVEAMLQEERSHVKVTGQEFAYGGDLGLITAITVCDAEGLERLWFNTGESVRVHLDIAALEDLPSPIYAMTIKNATGVEVYGTNTMFSKQPVEPLRKGDQRRVTFDFPINLMPGNYFFSFGFTHFFGTELSVIHRRYDAIKVEVHALDKSFGIANLHAKIGVSVIPTP
ncbi:MAG: Teichoic acids export ATP-binding protein TagH [Verrucomicrobia bacterium ADurb.Bin122]|nr:MAG: Teichoic acids export ATP-binding protein TagH [Verrucomicrobia bacterium ADurb.Bin122]